MRKRLPALLRRMAAGVYRCYTRVLDVQGRLTRCSAPAYPAGATMPDLRMERQFAGACRYSSFYWLHTRPAFPCLPRLHRGRRRTCRREIPTDACNYILPHTACARYRTWHYLHLTRLPRCTCVAHPGLCRYHYVAAVPPPPPPLRNAAARTRGTGRGW